MAGIRDLKSKLAAAADLLCRTTDPVERHLLGGDVRELERLFEIAMGPDPDLPAATPPPQDRSAAGGPIGSTQ